MCSTFCSSVNPPSDSPGSTSAVVKPVVRDNPQIGERFAWVARVSSSRSVFAFGVVCSCGKTSCESGGSIFSAPIMPTVWRVLPSESVNFIRYKVKLGVSSNTKTPESCQLLKRFAASRYGSSPTGKSILTMLCSLRDANAARSASLCTSYGAEQTSASEISVEYRSAWKGRN